MEQSHSNPSGRAERLRALRSFTAPDQRPVLAVDYDGTLAPIVADPDRAYPQPGVVRLLARIAPHLRGVAVISGRPARTAVRLGDLDAIPGLVVLGHYGRERWENGAISAPDVPEGVARVRAQLPEALSEVNAPEGVTVEDKGTSLSVHTRGAADPADALRRVRPTLERLAADNGLVVEPGRFVVELRPGGMDKGRALRSFVAERDASAVLFAGDDLGDQAAFAVVEELRGAGLRGITVCSGSTEVPELAARADLVVDGPGGLAELLEELLTVVEAPADVEDPGPAAY
ncbi:trehalose-phosphatase [Spiractinospora alimapuensis]|uniref:trehalose-phosphatase n=1 Tax=Spiractinospora alimapuensis TaxID=2820884 RepID=UPI001F40ED8A|nr:trehalose-phosphatase [Spiractinospora alimapuensis]QVQ50298.1 trehalose-phosphatase [Spiractinospora alimapuensis]